MNERRERKRERERDRERESRQTVRDRKVQKKKHPYRPRGVAL